MKRYLNTKVNLIRAVDMGCFRFAFCDSIFQPLAGGYRYLKLSREILKVKLFHTISVLLFELNIPLWLMFLAFNTSDAITIRTVLILPYISSS